MDVKAKYLFLEIKFLDMRKSWEPVRSSMRLGDDFDWLGVSLETFLQIRRLRRSVCGAHRYSAPHPSSNLQLSYKTERL